MEKKFAPRTSYDSTARNPAYAGGEKAIFVELRTLAKHFHPTVALFSEKILAGNDGRSTSLALELEYRN